MLTIVSYLRPLSYRSAGVVGLELIYWYNVLYKVDTGHYIIPISLHLLWKSCAQLKCNFSSFYMSIRFKMSVCLNMLKLYLFRFDSYGFSVHNNIQNKLAAPSHINFSMLVALNKKAIHLAITFQIIFCSSYRPNSFTHYLPNYICSSYRPIA